MSPLLAKLSSRVQPIVVGGPEPSLERFREAVGRGYVHIKFTETQGGTDLGVQLDESACLIESADLQNGTGSLHLEGTLTLDYQPVRCVADFELESLSGTGTLIFLKA